MWQVAAAYGVSSTDLDFSNDEEAAVRRRSVTVSMERRFGERWAVQAGGGLSLGGDVTVSGDRYDLEPGWLVTAGGSFRVLDGQEWLPFLLLSAASTVSSATAVGPRAEEASFTAIDALRVSLTVGKVFADAFAPYLVARAFAGPVFWERNGEDVTGTDQNYYQLGGGLLVTAGGRVSAYAEVIPLGELSASVGASVSF